MTDIKYIDGNFKTFRSNNQFTPIGIVLHAAGEEVFYQQEWIKITDFWQLEGITASANSLVYSDGLRERLFPSTTKTFHAGISHHKEFNLNNLNHHYFGLEFILRGKWKIDMFNKCMNTMLSDYLSNEHYESGALECAEVIKKHNIQDWDKRIVLHSEVSGIDVRPTDPKFDPGLIFNKKLFMELIKEKL